MSDLQERLNAARAAKKQIATDQDALAATVGAIVEAEKKALEARTIADGLAAQAKQMRETQSTLEAELTARVTAHVAEARAIADEIHSTLLP